MRMRTFCSHAVGYGDCHRVAVGRYGRTLADPEIFPCRGAPPSRCLPLLPSVDLCRKFTVTPASALSPAAAAVAAASNGVVSS